MSRTETRNLFETLVTKNPMTVEVRRAARRYLTFSNSNGTVTFGLLLAIILYAILFLTVVNMRGDFNPKIVLWIHLFVSSLVAPMTLHASIAGERERRSWDMLMVAPVTHAQVVVGKLLGGLAVQVAIAAALLLPTLVAAVSYGRQDGLSLYGLFRLELVLLATGAFCSALTMLISARVKRGFVALGVSFTVLLLIFVFFPIILLTLGGGGTPEMNDLVFGWHPAYALTTVDARTYTYLGYPSYSGPRDSFFAGWVQALAMFAFAVIFTMWTVRTVAFADNEVRFLPGKKKGTNA